MTSRIVFHVGYPKTGTTTLQSRVFPFHRDIDYLGKLIPGFGYSREGLAEAMAALTTTSEACWTSEAKIRNLFASLRRDAEGRLLVISSENFIHPASICPVQIARRVAQVVPDAEILITIRSQPMLLRSFFRNHGAFGAYLYFAKRESDPIALPLTADEWLTILLRAPHKGLIDTLHYDAIVGAYERSFGEQSVHVALYEDLDADPAAFAEGVASQLGVDGREFASLLGNHHDNAGLAPGAFEALAAQVRRGSTELTARATEPAPPASDEKPKAVEFSDSLNERVIAAYAEGNTRLAKRRNLDLMRFGYPAIV